MAKPKKNLDLRVFILKNGLTYTEVAREIPVSLPCFSMMLQRELAKSEKEEIRQAAKRALLKKESEVFNEDKETAD